MHGCGERRPGRPGGVPCGRAPCAGDGGRPVTAVLAGMVRLTRPRHPFEGRQLPVLGSMRRHGAAELLVVLPDGSKRLIPAAWSRAPRSRRRSYAGSADQTPCGRVIPQPPAPRPESARQPTPPDGQSHSENGAHCGPPRYVRTARGARRVTPGGATGQGPPRSAGLRPRSSSATARDWRAGVVRSRRIRWRWRPSA